jgi:hypothetical protein
MITCQEYIDTVREQLFDPEPGVGWANAELIGYLNSAMTRTIAAKMDAYPVIREISLEPGVVQSLPDDGCLFIDCLYNQAGNAVTLQAAHEFIRVKPDWAAASASNEVNYVLFDPRLPRQFHVSPPASSGATLTCMFGAFPPRITSVTDEVLMPDQYETALQTFMVARALAKASARQDLSKATAFMAEFERMVGARLQIDLQTPPQQDIRGVR